MIFPSGRGTCHELREEKVTLCNYLSARILNADGRFSRNLDYIFFAQYLPEINQVISNVSVALRKG